MTLKLYQVDAFADALFGGNPAAVVPLKKWLPDHTLQQLAAENNLSETAFFVPSEKKKLDYEIRWFTPQVEVDLCGHATLASAYVIFSLLKAKKRVVTFLSQSGTLKVRRTPTQLLMDFPAWHPQKTDAYPLNLAEMLGVNEIVGVYRNRDWLVELPTEQDVSNAEPDFNALKKLGAMIIITAPGAQVDFVSRFFAPSTGVDEDPVTGSAHAQLIPFWSKKLGKRNMQALQLSARKGRIHAEHHGQRVIIGGNCVLYLQGKIYL